MFEKVCINSLEVSVMNLLGIKIKTRFLFVFKLQGPGLQVSSVPGTEAENCAVSFCIQSAVTSQTTWPWKVGHSEVNGDTLFSIQENRGEDTTWATAAQCSSGGSGERPLAVAPSGAPGESLAGMWLSSPSPEN